ncbi:MAG: hypothetical protein ACTHNK_09000 [Thermomicrobiales bacterium]
MHNIPIELSANLDEARTRFLRDLGAWVDESIARYADAPATDVHDQGTFTTGWEPYLRATGDARALAFLTTLRDKIRDHFVAAGRWRHGYWTMHEAHHGTEHYELFLGALARLAPDDATTVAQLTDAAEHFGNWVADVPPWFNWDRGLYHSSFFGTDGVRLEPGLEVNIPDHLRCVNIALLAHAATQEQCYLDLAATYGGRWADAILQGDTLPLALADDGPLYDLTGVAEERYRSFVGQLSPNLDSPLDRAENFLASDATGAFLTLWQHTGDARFRQAAERLLDTLVTALGDPDAGSAADAIRKYRSVTGSDRYDAVVLAAVRPLAPCAWSTLALDLDFRLPTKPEGIGKRQDMLRWLEDGQPRRHNPILLTLAAELTGDAALATRALDSARAYFALARQALPDGRDHGCAARTVNAVARGHGRENHAGVTTAVLQPLLDFAPEPRQKEREQ